MLKKIIISGIFANCLLMLAAQSNTQEGDDIPATMELVFNPAVKQQIEYYAGRRKSQVNYMLGEGKYYCPIFEKALYREGLPLELKHLPIIELALNCGPDNVDKAIFTVINRHDSESFV
jgi:hypothetical protein